MRLNFLKFFPLLGLSLVLIRGQYASESILNDKASSYLYSRAQSHEHEKIIDRILELDLTERQVKEVISRIPFITQSDKQLLFGMVDEEVRYKDRLESQVHADAPRGLLPLGDDGERRILLKKFALGKIETEVQYKILMGIFATQEPVLHTYERIRDMGFLGEADLELMRRIAEGKLEAFYDRRMDRSVRYSQEYEISSVATNGFDLDALKSQGEYGRARHRFRGFHLPGSSDFFGELVVDVSDQSLRPDDGAQLEYLFLEWRGKYANFSIGDTQLGRSQVLLNREFRGFNYENKKWFDSSITTNFYLGSVPIALDGREGVEIDSQGIVGFNLDKDLGKDRTVSIGYQLARELENGTGREANILRFAHSARIAENLNFQSEFLSNYADRQKNEFRSSFAADMRLHYKYGGDSALLHYSRFGPDFFSPTGLDLQNLSQLEGVASFSENWGQWDLEGYWSRDSASVENSSLEIFRPVVGIHFQTLFGLDDLHGFYRFYSNREDADDRSRLYRSTTHWARLLKSTRAGQLEAWYRYRTYKDISFIDQNTREDEWNCSARGFYLWRRQDFAPEVFFGEERVKNLEGLKDLRQKGGVQLSFSFLKGNRAYARYAHWRAVSPQPDQDQQGKIFDMQLDFPISSSGGKKVKLTYQWEEQDLANSLSSTAYREAKLAYENLF